MQLENRNMVNWTLVTMERFSDASKHGYKKYTYTQRTYAKVRIKFRIRTS